MYLQRCTGHEKQLPSIFWRVTSPWTEEETMPRGGLQRGAFIVLEGLDRSGKSTQVRCGARLPAFAPHPTAMRARPDCVVRSCVLLLQGGTPGRVPQRQGRPIGQHQLPEPHHGRRFVDQLVPAERPGARWLPRFSRPRVPEPHSPTPRALPTCRAACSAVAAPHHWSVADALCAP